MLLLLVFFLSVQNTSAQLARKSEEVWPSIDAYFRINQKFRLYGTIGGTKLEESSYTDGAVGLFVDYFAFPLGIRQIFFPNHNDSLPGKFLWFRGGYQYSATPPSAKDPFKESMIVTEANARFHLPYQILATFKNRFDWRVNNGDFKGRYRPRLMLEKDFKTEFLTFTASGFGEYFSNFDDGSVNRFRTQLGIEFRVTRFLNYEVFWNHQYENQPEIQEVDAFGMCFKFYLTRKEKKSGIKTE